MEDENYRKIRMMVENAVGATWVGAQERIFGRLMVAASVSWIWVIAGLLYNLESRLTILGLLFAISGLALWQFTNYQKATRGFDLTEANRTVQDRMFIAAVAERIASEVLDDQDP